MALFKQNYEKLNEQYQISTDILKKLVAFYSDKKLVYSQMISGGCANLNIKIQLENEKPFILRIYIRDKSSAYREQKISSLLKPTLPIPLTYYVGEYKEYCFAVTEFIEGITLRDLLLGSLEYDLTEIMYEVGTILAKITQYKFDQAGFFDRNLNVTKQNSNESYTEFVEECLKNKLVLSALTSKTISEIEQFFRKYSYLLETDEKHLVHADFDPANILVNRIDGAWKVTGVLDWEFSFSGSVLWDVANMLRYAHQMPIQFEEDFLKGLNETNVFLPENWRISVNLLNLVSLLDALGRSDPKNRPNQYLDICNLIDYIISKLNEIH